MENITGRNYCHPLPVLCLEELLICFGRDCIYWSWGHKESNLTKPLRGTGITIYALQSLGEGKSMWLLLFGKKHSFLSNSSNISIPKTFMSTVNISGTYAYSCADMSCLIQNILPFISQRLHLPHVQVHLLAPSSLWDCLFCVFPSTYRSVQLCGPFGSAHCSLLHVSEGLFLFYHVVSTAGFGNFSLVLPCTRFLTLTPAVTHLYEHRVERLRVLYTAIHLNASSMLARD